uniref:HSF-type DNA-binding domain-containing protein n=1 Tax=Kalanchoe fedtschenkoi TaxID=63787 RepID=A0A7N0V6J5_KALFE
MAKLEYELLREFDRVVAQCDQAQKTRGDSSNTSLTNHELGLITANPTSGVSEAGSNASTSHVNNKIPETAAEMAAEVATIGQGTDVVPSFLPQDQVILSRQMHGKLRDKSVPQFLSKIYEIVDNPNTDYLVQWGFDGKSFVVHDANAFCQFILPKYFKHNHFSSFIRQLNTYGFRKIDAAKWEFANEQFQRGKRHLLKYIKRRRSGNRMRFESEKQDENLQKALSAKITNLNKQVEVSHSLISAFEERVQVIELKYKKMASFLSQTIQNPGLVAELVRGKASVEAKHGGKPSEQKIATVVSDETTKASSASNHMLLVNAQTPNQTTEMKTSVSITAPSFGESSSSPTEPQGSAEEMVLNSLESLQDELMNESEACEGIVTEQCLSYFHELESLIEEESDGWVAYVDAQPIDRKS